jgi:hypothetical protein
LLLQNRSKMPHKPFIYILFLLSASFLKAQIDPAPTFSYEYELGINFAHYLHNEKGVNILIKKVLVPKEKRHGYILRNFVTQIGYLHSNGSDKVTKLNSETLVDSTYGVGKTRFFYHVGVEKFKQVRRSCFWYGTEVGLFYQINTTNSRETFYYPFGGISLVHNLSLVEHDYGIPISIYLGYRFNITKKIGIGINIGANTQFFRQIRVKNEPEKIAISQIKRSYNAKLVERRILQQLFLMWRF